MTRTAVSARQYVRRLRGGSQAHLLRASDGYYYVTKFQNNPQHIRVLANEFFANRLGTLLGLPVPEPRIIEVSEDFIRSANLKIELIGHQIPCESGLQLGLRFVADPERETIFEYLPESILKLVVNKGDFARMIAFDKWLGNCDGRQAIFTKNAGKRLYRATFIDQGYCFNAEQWTFPDRALHGVYSKNEVYEDVSGWRSFEPLLSRIEAIDYADLWRCAAQIPLEWFEHDGEGLFQLIETLYKRRSVVRDLITRFQESSRKPFPRWSDGDNVCSLLSAASRSIEGLHAHELAEVEGFS
jgi:hypothetical protein